MFMPERLFDCEELDDLKCVAALARIPTQLSQLNEAIILTLTLEPLKLRGVSDDGQLSRTSKILENQMEEARITVDTHWAFRILALAMIVPNRREHAVRKIREVANGRLKHLSADTQLNEGVLSISGNESLHLRDTLLELLLLDSKGLQTHSLVGASCFEAALTLSY